MLKSIALGTVLALAGTFCMFLIFNWLYIQKKDPLKYNLEIYYPNAKNISISDTGATFDIDVDGKTRKFFFTCTSYGSNAQTICLNGCNGIK